MNLKEQMSYLSGGISQEDKVKMIVEGKHLNAAEVGVAVRKMLSSSFTAQSIKQNEKAISDAVLEYISDMDRNEKEMEAGQLTPAGLASSLGGGAKAIVNKLKKQGVKLVSKNKTHLEVS